MSAGGLILESPRFKNFSHEKIFGASPFLEEIKPFNRDISGLPLIFQGKVNSCVSCAITFIRQWQDKNKPDLSWEWLADISNTKPAGATPSQVLEPARKTGILPQGQWDSNLKDVNFEAALNSAYEYRIGNYFYVRDLSKNGLYHAMKETPIAIGVRDWKGVGPHFMVAFDATDDGQMLKCANWWRDDTQDVQVVPFESVVVAVSFRELPEGFVKSAARLSAYTVLMDKMKYYLKYVLT